MNNKWFPRTPKYGDKVVIDMKLGGAALGTYRGRGELFPGVHCVYIEQIGSFFTAETAIPVDEIQAFAYPDDDTFIRMQTEANLKQELFKKSTQADVHNPDEHGGIILPPRTLPSDVEGLIK